jgi:hypothetical protein
VLLKYLDEVAFRVSGLAWLGSIVQPVQPELIGAKWSFAATQGTAKISKISKRIFYG